jgi:hypothetical protein
VYVCGASLAQNSGSSEETLLVNFALGRRSKGRLIPNRMASGTYSSAETRKTFKINNASARTQNDLSTMANAYSGEAGSELTPHQQSQLNQLAASIGYGSQLIFSTEEKGGGKHVDGSRVKDKGEPDRTTETLMEQQRRFRRNRHGREDTSTPLNEGRQTLHQKKNGSETKKQSTGTANGTSASASQSPGARAPYTTENHNQFKSSPESNTEEDEWDYRKSRRIIGRQLRRMAEQEQVEESQKKAKGRGPGKAVRAKKAKSAESMKIKKKRKPYTRKLKVPPKEQGSMPAATSSGKQDTTVQQVPQATKRLDESNKNDESKSAV